MYRQRDKANYCWIMRLLSVRMRNGDDDDDDEVHTTGLEPQGLTHRVSTYRAAQ